MSRWFLWDYARLLGSWSREEARIYRHKQQSIAGELNVMIALSVDNTEYAHYTILTLSVLDISTRPLAQASLKSVGRVQILNHSTIWRVQFSSPRNYSNCNIKNVFTLHFGQKIPKHKLTIISILQSFVLRKASDVLHSARQNGFPLVIIT